MKEKGLTVLQTAAGILLMSLSIYIGLLSLKGIARAELRWKTEEVVEALEYIKSASVATGTQYNLFCFNDRILIRQGIDCIGKINLPASMTIPEDITGRWIRFKGTCATPHAGTILLQYPALGMQARITVDIGVGRIRVYYEPL